MAYDDLAAQLRASVGALVRAGRAHPEAWPEHRAQTLGFLMREGPLTTAELATRRRVRHQSVQSTVTDLAAEGLVTRGPDPRDQRARLVTLTDLGLRTLRHELERRERVLAEAIGVALDDEQRELLARVPALLDRLTAHVAAQAG